MHKKSFSLLLAVIITCLFSSPCLAAGPALEWEPDVQGSFVLSMCRDMDGRIWVGTEDNGVWCWDSTLAEKDILKKGKEPKTKDAKDKSAKEPDSKTNASKEKKDSKDAKANEPESKENASKEKKDSNQKQGKPAVKSAPPGWTHYTRELTGGGKETSGPTINSGIKCLSALGDDDAYAIACDRLGRIWVGHLNHGVSVFNGEKWRNYDILTGPLGERVFDIKTCPVDGDVWIATSAGLTRYRISQDAWTYYTREDGLPSDQIQCMSFDKKGTIYAGTQCDGLAICEPDSEARGQGKADSGQRTADSGLAATQRKADSGQRTADSSVAATQRGAGKVVIADGSETANLQPPASSLQPPTSRLQPPASPKRVLEYNVWRHVTTPDNSYELPVVPLGDGLPSNLINDILVVWNGYVYVATNAGLAQSTDSGRSWTFVRGEDWEAKAKGRYNPPNAEQLSAARKAGLIAKDKILLEDFCICLAEDTKGMLWVGHRDKPYEVIDPKLEKRVDQDKEQARPWLDGYIKVMLALPRNKMLIGKYGGGPKKMENPLASHPRGTPPPPLPSPAPPPTAEELAALLGRLKTKSPLPPGEANNPSPLPLGEGKGEGESASRLRPPASGLQPPASSLQPIQNCYLGDDWTTWGDWVGRYGREYAVLCAACTPFDHNFDVNSLLKLYRRIDSEYGSKGDHLRGWVHWLETRNQRTLYDPVAGVRRQSEWDDHGEVYSPLKEGPNINVAVIVPEGVHRVSAYFFNKDGHSEKNRFRDYLLTLYRYKLKPFDLSGKEAPYYQPDNLDLLGHARVCDFWGGVYKRFVVTGPGTYLLRIERNGSFNTTVCGVFVDKLAGPAADYDNYPIPWLGGVYCMAPPIEPANKKDDPIVRRAREVWDAALAARSDPSRVAFCRRCQLLAYRSASSVPFKDNSVQSMMRQRSLLWNWRWDLGLCTQDDRQWFVMTMDEGWKRQIASTPGLAWQKTRRPLWDGSPDGYWNHVDEVKKLNPKEDKQDNNPENKQKNKQENGPEKSPENQK